MRYFKPRNTSCYITGDWHIYFVFYSYMKNLAHDSDYRVIQQIVKIYVGELKDACEIRFTNKRIRVGASWKTNLIRSCWTFFVDVSYESNISTFFIGHIWALRGLVYIIWKYEKQRKTRWHPLSVAFFHVIYLPPRNRRWKYFRA